MVNHGKASRLGVKNYIIPIVPIVPMSTPRGNLGTCSIGKGNKLQISDDLADAGWWFLNWLVVWNMNFMTFHIYISFYIQLTNMFQRG